MRRVCKSEVTITPIAKPDGLEYCLACWQDFMGQDDRDLSASRMRLQTARDEHEDAAGYESDPYGEQRKADLRIGAATNAAIDDLKPCSRWAIFKKCGVASVWRFPQLSLIDAMQTAESELREKLQKNIDTSRYFA